MTEMTDPPPGFSGTHHLDGSICTYVYERKCSHPYHGDLAGVQFDANDQAQGVERRICKNCQGSIIKVKTHWLLEETFDETCDVRFDDPKNPTEAVQILHEPEKGTSVTAISDIERAEMMLSLNLNEEGNPLSAEERAKLEALVASQQAAPEATQPATQPAQAAPQGDLQATDIQTLVQQEIAKALGGTPQPQGLTIEQVLQQIDPRDSDTALAMLDWLQQTGRLQVIGNLAGGGYLFHYAEPKGTSKQGYMPGSTKGGRLVDQAVEQARSQGAKPRQVGMCDKCWSAVERHEDGSISLDGDPTATAHSDGTPHTFN